MIIHDGKVAACPELTLSEERLRWVRQNDEVKPLLPRYIAANKATTAIL